MVTSTLEMNMTFNTNVHLKFKIQKITFKKKKKIEGKTET